MLCLRCTDVTYPTYKALMIELTVAALISTTTQVVAAALNHSSLQGLRLINKLRAPASHQPKDVLYPFGYLLNFLSMLYHLQETEDHMGTSVILEEYRPPIFL